MEIRSIKSHMKGMNNKGQTMIVGIMVLVMALLIFIALLQPLKSIFDEARECDTLNCEGYVYPDASGSACTTSNRSYDPTLSTDDLSCTVLDLGIPYIILAVLIGLVTKLIHGQLVEPPPQAYGGYPY